MLQSINFLIDMYSNRRSVWRLKQTCSETYMNNLAGIFVQGQMAVMVNKCVAVLLVLLLIAVSLYEVHTDIVVLYIHMKYLPYVAYIWHKYGTSMVIKKVKLISVLTYRYSDLGSICRLH